MTPLDAMRSALDALLSCTKHFADNDISWNSAVDEAVNSLHTAIAEMESAEPVAWHGVTGDYGYHFLSFQEQPGMTPLYAHPAQFRDSIIEDCAAVCEGFDARYRYNYGAAYAAAIRELKGK